MVTGNKDLKFELQILFEGYREDSLQSDPDLTEITVDTVMSKYVDIDSLGQLYEKDTVSVEVTYHNNRTMKQAENIIGYLISQGADSRNITGFVNAIPAIMPESKRTIVKARITKM
jgi:hypothetical protein